MCSDMGERRGLQYDEYSEENRSSRTPSAYLGIADRVMTAPERTAMVDELNGKKFDKVKLRMKENIEIYWYASICSGISSAI
jgi:hypothetical protein